MKKAKNIKQFKESLLGWKQHKKVFSIYFNKNVSKEFCKIFSNLNDQDSK